MEEFWAGKGLILRSPPSKAGSLRLNGQAVLQSLDTVMEVLQRLVCNILPVNCVQRGNSIECSFADKCIWQKFQIYCTAAKRKMGQNSKFIASTEMKTRINRQQKLILFNLETLRQRNFAAKK